MLIHSNNVHWFSGDSLIIFTDAGACVNITVMQTIEHGQHSCPFTSTTSPPRHLPSYSTVTISVGARRTVPKDVHVLFPEPVKM